jgi:hypothetical protein
LKGANQRKALSRTIKVSTFRVADEKTKGSMMVSALPIFSLDKAAGMRSSVQNKSLIHDGGALLGFRSHAIDLYSIQDEPTETQGNLVIPRCIPE